MASQQALRTFSEYVIRRNWAAELLLPKNPGQGSALISRSHPIPEPRLRRVGGTTTIYGEVRRAGGDDPRAWLLPLGGTKQVKVNVSKELARELGAQLYGLVGLEGEAVWRAGDWELLEFTATNVVPFTDSDPVKAFEELSRAAGGRWDGVDADKYLQRLRSEDEDE
jgi:hypothetical protein